MPRTETSTPFPQNGFNALARFDYETGHGHNEDIRYYQQNVNDRIARGTIASYEPDNEVGKVTFGDLGDTWVIRPSLLNVARAAYKRYDYSYAPSDSHTLADFGADFPNYNTVPVLPAIGGYLGNASQAISHTVNEDIELNDALSWVKGNHNYQFRGGLSSAAVSKHCGERPSLQLWRPLHRAFRWRHGAGTAFLRDFLKLPEPVWHPA